jgi:hypothetical protein
LSAKAITPHSGGSEAPHQESGRYAHQRPDQHVPAKLRRGLGCARQQNTPEFSGIGCAQLRRDRIDLQHAEYHVGQHDDGETQHVVHPDREISEQTDHPGDVEMFRPQAGHGDAVPLQPFGHLSVKHLIAGRVADDETADAPEAPGDERCKLGDDQNRPQHGQAERDEVRHPHPKSILDRPDNCDNQQGECEWRKDRAGEIKGGEDENGGGKTD